MTEEETEEMLQALEQIAVWSFVVAFAVLVFGLAFAVVASTAGWL